MYLGCTWPVRQNNRIFCTGEQFPQCPSRSDIAGPRVGHDDPERPEGPIRVVMISERPDLDQAAFVRTGRASCTSNLGVFCWGHVEHTSNCTTHRENLTNSPFFRECTHYWSCGAGPDAPLWRFFQALRIGGLSARFRDDAPLVDYAITDLRNAALAWLEADMRLRPGRTRLEFLGSARVGGNQDANINSSLDLFVSSYSAPNIIAAPAVASLSGSYLRSSRTPITDAEYVIRQGSIRLSFVPHVVRHRVPPESINSVFLIFKAHLVLTMGVRCAPRTLTFRDRTITVEQGQDGFPTVAGDRMIFADAQGRKVNFPPPRIEVEFDRGPFSDPPMQLLSKSRIAQFGDCLALSNAGNEFAGTSFFVPAFKSNQQHAASYDVWRGGMNLVWDITP